MCIKFEIALKINGNNSNKNHKFYNISCLKQPTVF